MSHKMHYVSFLFGRWDSGPECGRRGFPDVEIPVENWNGPSLWLLS